ncbi:ATG33 Autophagy-related protein 33 [Candida maltosa Xu316]|uniref:Autophagy-related protein 33 n=1 Tax=Candida maltosa (strain Xu316) TaxID=1245528 RepID=M3IS08_CANMX|nr:hypothetical protein G210_5923 [Candida maltosa Xu316]
MAGTCITTIKFLGVGSLGLLTSSIVYQSITNLPNLIQQFNCQFQPSASTSAIELFNQQLSKLKTFIFGNRLINGGLTVLSTALFTLAFKYSPVYEKHPYLIYSALGAPLTLIVLYFKNWNYEATLLSKKPVELKTNESKEKVNHNEEEDEEEPEIISKVTSADSLLGRSYVHLSDESGISTPNSSQPATPKVQPKDDEQQPVEDKTQEELEVEQEVENILVKKEIVQELKKVESGYIVGSYVSGTSLLIAIVGLFGDYYLL